MVCVTGKTLMCDCVIHYTDDMILFNFSVVIVVHSLIYFLLTNLCYAKKFNKNITENSTNKEIIFNHILLYLLISLSIDLFIYFIHPSIHPSIIYATHP